jgi:hypothetical protein
LLQSMSLLFGLPTRGVTWRESVVERAGEHVR